MAIYRSKHTSSVKLKFDRDDESDFDFATLVEHNVPFAEQSIWLERRQAIRVAKAILKKYEPEALA